MESTDLKWRKASYSSNGGGECVEVGEARRGVLVRDTKERTGDVLRFSPDAWRRFVDRVKRSLADPQPHASRGYPSRLGGRRTGVSSLQTRRGMRGKGWGARSAPQPWAPGPGATCVALRSPERRLQVSWCGRRGAVSERLCAFLGHRCGGNCRACTFRDH